MALKKIGLLGGSFDPIHLAHIALAETACQALRLDQLQLIPAADPWQRAPLQATPQQRLALAELAIAGHPHLCVNPVEIERGGKTYTVDTLRQLPAGADYYWVLGADQLGNFCSWHEWKEIARLAYLAVAQRPGTSVSVPPELARHLDTLGRRIIELPFEPMPISASDVRRRLAAGLSVQGLLDVAVAHYIQRYKLYHPPLS